MALNFEALRTEQARLNATNADWKERYVKMPEGEGSVTVRLLPWPDHALPYVATRIHKIGQKTYHSPLVLDEKGRWSGVCPFQAEIRKLWLEIERLERGGKMDAARELRNTAGQMRQQERFYWNAIVRKETKENGEVVTDVGPKILSIGKDLQARVINAILGNAAMDDTGYGDITDFATGRDFRIRKKLKKGANMSYPEYSESTFLAPSKAGTESQWKRWLDSVNDLKAERKLRPLDELKEVIEVYMGRKAEAYPVEVVRPAVVQVQKPVPAKVVVEEDVEIDEDFLSDLRSM